MSLSKTIKMHVPLVGISLGKTKVSFETSGFQGASCQSATAAFEAAIGSVEDEVIKDEFYEGEERRDFLSDGSGE